MQNYSLGLFQECLKFYLALPGWKSDQSYAVFLIGMHRLPLLIYEVSNFAAVQYHFAYIISMIMESYMKGRNKFSDMSCILK